MCDELQNGSLPLLILSPNGRADDGVNRDCFTINPDLPNTVVNDRMVMFLGWWWWWIFCVSVNRRFGGVCGRGG